MGAGPSKIADSASPEQKRQIGTFYLGRKEKYAIQALSTIFQTMMEKNRLFDIHTLLSTETDKGCNALFMTIQSTLENEFLRLKFPDPKRPSFSTIVSSVPKGVYERDLAATQARNAACGNLSQFLVRLITLVSALAVSIKSNDNISSLLIPVPPATIEKVTSHTLKMIPEIAKFGKRELVKTTEALDVDPDDIITFLKQANFLTENGSNYILKSSNYVITRDSSLIYDASPSKTSTAVFLFEMKLTDRTLPVSPLARMQSQAAPYNRMQSQAAPYNRMQSQAAPYNRMQSQAAPYNRMQSQAAPYMQSQAALYNRTKSQAFPYSKPTSNPPQSVVTYGGPGALSVFSGKNTTVIGNKSRRMTRRRMAMHRKTRRRQHGGGMEQLSAEKSLFLITLTPIDYTSGVRPISFYANALGYTYEYDTIATNSGTIKSTPILTRLDDIFRSAHTTYTTEPPSTDEKEMDKDRFLKLQSYDKDTTRTVLDKIMADFHTVNDEKIAGTGTAPAPYRAFLLASSEAANGVTHLLCSDKWQNQWVTSVLTYSLLQSLFNDKVDGTMSPRSAEECKKMMKVFASSGAMIESAQPGNVATSLYNLRFAKRPISLDASICKQTVSIDPRRDETVPSDVAILRKAHNQIREAFEAHINNVIAFISPLVKVMRSSTQALTFKLEPVFFTTEEGTSLDFLEKKIAEARLLLGTHQLTVEKIYHDAVEALALSKSGITSAAIGTN